MQRLPLAVVALAGTVLTGCLLSEEDCGHGFIADGDRCVPVEAPPPFRRGDARPEPDGALDPPPEPEPPVDLTPDDWAPFDIALIVDDTRRDSVSQTPESPGADIDAIEVFGPTPVGEQSLGAGFEVLGSMFTDPFRANINLDPDATVGAADGRAASLGPGGGYIFVRLQLARPAHRGDRIVVTEALEAAGREDAYAFYMCTSAEGLQDCRAVGAGGAGVTRFVLE